MVDPNIIITGVITFAGGGALAAGVKAWNELRAGAAGRISDTVGSLRDQRDEEAERARLGRLDADHYHALVGRLLFQISKMGIEPVVTVDDLVPPSQREENEAPPPPATTRRGRRASAA